MSRCRVEVRLPGLPDGAARAASEALEADNVGFPPGQSMEVRAGQDSLEIDFSADASIASLASTIDEVLSHVQASLGATRC